MAEITLNNITNAKDLICFNTCPNIVTIASTATTNTYASARINVEGLYPTDNTKPSKITINGYTINGTDDINKLQGKRFYRTTNNSSNSNFVCISIVNALKSIPQIAMNYNVIYAAGGVLTITAKNSGAKYSLTIESENLTNFSVLQNVRGLTTDEMSGQYFSRVYVDLYYNDTTSQRTIRSSNTQADFKYLTTLQKEYYKDSVSFNLTPALLTVSDNNNTTIWKADIYAMVDSNALELGTITDNYITNGYLVNQGNTYINANDVSNQTIPALNVKRGTEKQQYNNTTLYVFEPNIPISLYKLSGQDTENVTIEYLESDETVTTSATTTINLSSLKNLNTYTIELDEETMRDSHYIDLTFSFGTLRYNVINPPYSQAECNRIYWYNSYGGVSFFDFVGDKREERKTTTETYNKSLLDYYKNDKQEQETVYFRENDITVSLTSHIIDMDGVYNLYDLHNSYKAWVNINGVDYYIIVTQLTIDEPADNVYTATIKYKYSLLDSFA